jgi:hypothetical protein
LKEIIGGIPGHVPEISVVLRIFPESSGIFSFPPDLCCHFSVLKKRNYSNCLKFCYFVCRYLFALILVSNMTTKYFFIYQSDFFPNFIIIFQFYHLISSHNILYLLNMLSYGLNRLGREFIINLRPYMVRNLRLRQHPLIHPY